MARHVSRDQHLLTDYSCTEKVMAVAGACGLACEVRRESERGRGRLGPQGLCQAERDGHVGASDDDCSTAGQSQQLAGRGPIPRENGCPSRSACCGPWPALRCAPFPSAHCCLSSPRPRRSRSGVATPRTKQLWVVSYQCRRCVDVACVRLGDCGCERALRVAFPGSRYGWASIGSGEVVRTPLGTP